MSSWSGRIASKLSGHTFVQKKYGYRNFSLRTIPNVVRNQDGAHISAAVLPFHFDFVDERLKKALIRRNVDVDEVERLYNSQVRNDYEFNSPALPQQDSALWGYVYGEHLVRSKVRLETLSKEEEFLRKYLQCTVDELTIRMKRYYPLLDWQSRFEHELAQVKLPINQEFEDAHAEATAELITRSPLNYIAYHKNNAFIHKYDDTDEFKDHLPQQLESKLIAYYEFLWDHSSPKADKNKYFGTVKAIEKALSTPLESLSSQFRTSWDAFVEDSFAQSDIATVSTVVGIVQSATSVVDVKTEKQAKELVNEIWEILDFGSRSINAAQASVCSNLFFGKNCSENLLNKDVQTIKSIVSNADLERLKVLRRAVQIKQYLKNYPASRLLLGALIQQFPVQFAPLFTQEATLQSAITQNQTPLETFATHLKTLHDAQAAFAESVQQLAQFVTKNSDLKSCAVANALRSLQGQVKLANQCPLITSLEASAKVAQEKGDLDGELQLRATAKYLKTVKNVPWYKLFRAVVAPRRDQWSGDELEAMSTFVTTNANEAFETLFKNIVDSIKSNAILPSDINSLKSSLAKQWDDVQKKGAKANEARIHVNTAFQQIKFQHDDLNFNRIKENYNPLDIYLSNYNYL